MILFGKKRNPTPRYMTPTPIEIVGTALFALAVAHTFLTKYFERLAHLQPAHAGFWHLLGEVEVVFGFWAFVFILFYVAVAGATPATQYLESLSYTEPMFVFVVMVIAASRPILDLADLAIFRLARFVPVPRSVAFYFVVLSFTPLLGSFITEPAAMTVTALVLKRQYYDRGLSRPFMYAVLGVLFVNVSIGGVLTHFAAPPVLMVAGTWGWDSDPTFMFRTFGYKAMLAVALNTAALCVLFRLQLRSLGRRTDSDVHNGDAAAMAAPLWVIAAHIGFLVFTVVHVHHSKMFMGSFLFFLAFVFVTQEFQERLKLRESLLVAGFLAGLVTLGGLQQWWLEPVLGSLNAFPLFLGATGLTAVTDNAALTYLGSLVPGLSARMKYALVAGSVTGGGLTVIANAPNPAGYSILNPSFCGEERGMTGISPLGLVAAAVVPTLIAGCCFWLLPALW